MIEDVYSDLLLYTVLCTLTHWQVTVNLLTVPER